MDVTPYVSDVQINTHADDSVRETIGGRRMFVGGTIHTTIEFVLLNTPDTRAFFYDYENHHVLSIHGTEYTFRLQGVSIESTGVARVNGVVTARTMGFLSGSTIGAALHSGGLLGSTGRARIMDVIAEGPMRGPSLPRRTYGRTLSDLSAALVAMQGAMIATVGVSNLLSPAPTTPAKAEKLPLRIRRLLDL